MSKPHNYRPIRSISATSMRSKKRSWCRREDSSLQIGKDLLLCKSDDLIGIKVLIPKEKHVKIIKNQTLFSLFIFLIVSPLFARQNNAYETEPLKPVVPHAADVRVIVDQFQEMLDNVNTKFGDGTHLKGRVMWLDSIALNLQFQPGDPELKIPVEVIKKFEMRAEKPFWPIATSILVGGFVGAVSPIDVNDRSTHALNRMTSLGIGTTSGLVAGLFVRNAFPEQWIEVPLELVRLGIKK